MKLSAAIEAASAKFEKAGIEFIGTPESGAGVRWKTQFLRNELYFS